jgi:hypothetical protein
VIFSAANADVDAAITPAATIVLMNFIEVSVCERVATTYHFDQEAKTRAPVRQQINAAYPVPHALAWADGFPHENMICTYAHPAENHGAARPSYSRTPGRHCKNRKAPGLERTVNGGISLCTAIAEAARVVLADRAALSQARLEISWAAPSATSDSGAA